MGLFNKEIECEQCNLTKPKKQIGIYDTSHQGRRKDGKKFKFCNDCMVGMLIKQLRENEEKAVIIYPTKKYNAYVFYQFNGNDNFLNDMETFLPPEYAECNLCGNQAFYTWSPLDIVYNNPYEWKVDFDKQSECIYLCKECLITQFHQKLMNENVKFDAIYPPIGGRGLCTPWQV